MPGYDSWKQKRRGAGRGSRTPEGTRPSDLQSDAFDHFAIPAYLMQSTNSILFKTMWWTTVTLPYLTLNGWIWGFSHDLQTMEPAQGFEPGTYGLQNRRSNQLSYAGAWCVSQLLLTVTS